MKSSSKQIKSTPAARRNTPAELASKEKKRVRIGETYREVGSPGLQIAMGFINEAYNAELVWPTVEPLFSRIRRSDPEISIVREVFKALARRMHFEWELPDEPSDDDKKAQEFANEVMEDVDGGPGKLMETIVGFVPFMGWGWWETPLAYRDPSWIPPDGDEWRSQYDDGRIGIRRFGFRDHSTFAGWEMTENGRMTGFIQQMPPMTPTPLTRTLKLENSLHLVFGDPANPEGLSPLEAVWRLERIKYGYEIINGIGFEHSAGHLALTKTEAGSITDDDLVKIKEAAKAVLTAREGNYAFYPFGIQGEVKDVPFASAPSLLATIKYYGILKLQIFNMQWVTLSATTGSGSYSAMQDSSGMFLTTFNSMMAGIADQIDLQIGRRIFELNEGAFPGMTKRPRLRIRPIEKEVNLTDLGNLIKALNFMPIGADDIKAIRKATKFLPETLPDPDDPSTIMPAAGAAGMLPGGGAADAGGPGDEEPDQGDAGDQDEEIRPAPADKAQLAHDILRQLIDLQEPNELYSPDQPRHPAGSQAGGEWAPAGGQSSPRYTTMRGTPYEVRSATEDDYDNWSRGLELKTMTQEQKLANSLFEVNGSEDDAETKVIVDEEGNIQSCYLGESTEPGTIEFKYEIESRIIEENSGGSTQGFEVVALSTAPINLSKTGQGGWGVAALYQAVKQAQGSGADFVFLTAVGPAFKFYEACGMKSVSDHGVEMTGYYIMDSDRMEAFVAAVETYGGQR